VKDEATTTPTPALANPAPLGLMGFGMTTVLLNIHNAGFFGQDVMVLAMGIFYGGLAQIVAGIMEFRKGNTFGLTAFTSYGLFWLSLVFIILGEKHGWFAHDPAFLGWYLFMWGVFTCAMWVGTWGKNRAIQFVFLSLTVLFWLLAIGHWFPVAGWFRQATGIEGIICGLSAIYLAVAEVLNEARGRAVLPICEVGPRR
jgi:succinate-acetate transporter protein